MALYEAEFLPPSLCWCNAFRICAYCSEVSNAGGLEVESVVRTFMFALVRSVMLVLLMSARVVRSAFGVGDNDNDVGGLTEEGGRTTTEGGGGP